jgi:hypothetical protein
MHPYGKIFHSARTRRPLALTVVTAARAAPRTTMQLTLVRSMVLALWLAALAACAVAAPSPTPQPPTPLPATPLPASATPRPATPPTLADANNPQDSPDYVASVTQIGPPRWVYLLRYAGNFVLTAPGVKPKTAFTAVILHATHGVNAANVRVVSAARGYSSIATPAPVTPQATITHCASSDTDIQISSADAASGWDELTIEVRGDSSGLVYFGFDKACASFNPSFTLGWAGPLAGP